MAVMHIETFELYHNDQNIVPDGYVEIDELIAPTIQVLNQKGYNTRFCCSGHPLDDTLVIDSSTEKGYFKGGFLLESYIAFEEGVSLPFLPPDFVASQNTYASRTRLVIKKVYEINNAFDNQFFEKSRKIFETMKQLYQWALDLPEFETMNCENEVADK